MQPWKAGAREAGGSREQGTEKQPPGSSSLRTVKLKGDFARFFHTHHCTAWT